MEHRRRSWADRSGAAGRVHRHPRSGRKPAAPPSPPPCRPGTRPAGAAVTAVTATGARDGTTRTGPAVPAWASAAAVGADAHRARITGGPTGGCATDTTAAHPAGITAGAARTTVGGDGVPGRTCFAITGGTGVTAIAAAATVTVDSSEAGGRCPAGAAGCSGSTIHPVGVAALLLKPRETNHCSRGQCHGIRKVPIAPAITELSEGTPDRLCHLVAHDSRGLQQRHRIW